MKIDIITGFPDILETPLKQSIIGQGIKKKCVEIALHNLRDFTVDKHRTIDDYPYGGGPGMVLKAEPIALALDAILEKANFDEVLILMPSPRGVRLEQPSVVKFSLKKHLIFICGHYKGIDERIVELYHIEEFSIGDYILSSGEIAALAAVDSIVRLLPGVIKDIDSAWTDSFSDHLLDSAYYTRPEAFRNLRVPNVLLSGNHQKISEWHLRERINVTQKRRPDLLKKYNELIKDESK
jgi:tRNA (guanine37-N1)-methyltransferase